MRQEHEVRSLHADGARKGEKKALDHVVSESHSASCGPLVLSDQQISKC